VHLRWGQRIATIRVLRSKKVEVVALLLLFDLLGWHIEEKNEKKNTKLNPRQFVVCAKPGVSMILLIHL
jgi:hypothetical protein